MSSQSPSLIVLSEGDHIKVDQRTPSDIHYCYIDPSNHRLWDAYVVGENGKPTELTFIEYNQDNKAELSVVILRHPLFDNQGVVQYQRSPSADLRTFHVEYSKEPILPAGITHTPSNRIQDILNIPAHCHRQLANCSF